MVATQHQIDADRRPPIGLPMTYRVGGVPRTGRVCYYQRGTGHPDYQVCDDLYPNVWRTLVLDDARIVEPPEYRRHPP
jgi:hypothetical protein